MVIQSMQSSANNGATLGSEIQPAFRLRWREKADISLNLSEQGIHGARPELDGMVGTCGRKRLSIRAPCNALHGSFVGDQSSEFLTTSQVRHPHPSRTGRNDGLSIRTHGKPAHRTYLHRTQGLAADGFPDLDSVQALGCYCFAIWAPCHAPGMTGNRAEQLAAEYFPKPKRGSSRQELPPPSE